MPKIWSRIHFISVLSIDLEHFLPCIGANLTWAVPGCWFALVLVLPNPKVEPPPKLDPKIE